MVHVLDLLRLFVMTYFSLWLVGFALCFFTRKRSRHLHTGPSISTSRHGPEKEGQRADYHADN